LEGEEREDGDAQDCAADQQRHYQHLLLNGAVSKWFHGFKAGPLRL
jgi:hypothetical protein